MDVVILRGFHMILNIYGLHARGFRLAQGARNWSFLRHVREYFLVSMASGNRVGGRHTTDVVRGGM